jgi:DNA mismatch repair protein MutL
MKTINILSPDVVAKIAAGEVVERPASVVKELIENALDAGATHIQIELEDGGTKKIVVKDNGQGMSEEDILVCFQPHSTSKISTDADLSSIQSLGFRGEALSSIAAVSRMTIKSRPRYSESGYSLELVGGIVEDEQPIGMPPGTEISVESLFYSTPARRKFLKESASELRYVVEVVTRYTMAFPKIGFTLIHNKEKVIHFSADEKISHRAQSVLGEHISQALLPIDHQSRYGKVTGFIGKPQTAHPSTKLQYLFVNNRIITDTKISRVLAESFGSLIEPRTYPPCILFITVPGESVDVNVHPRKEEVAFAYPREIQELIKDGTNHTLKNNNITYTHRSRQPDMDTYTADFLKNNVTPWNVKDITEGTIIQIHNLYLVTASPQGMLLIDQHAAHERILFEQFKEAFQKTRSHQIQYRFPEPQVFDLGPDQALLLSHHLETFQRIGFDIEQFGNHTFKLSAVPELYKERNHIQLITEVLHDIVEGKGLKTLDRETERTLSYLACRSAIKAGDALEAQEQKKLVEKLLSLTTPYTCPHGRPTHIEVSLTELDKMFKRR